MLSDVTVGDWVRVSRLGREPRCARVLRVTKTRLYTAGDICYRKSDGRQIGSDYPTWARRACRDEVAQAVRWDHLQTLIQQLSRLRTDDCRARVQKQHVLALQAVLDALQKGK